MRTTVLILATSLTVCGSAILSAPASADQPGTAVQAKHQPSVPPGLAKKGGVPPGLAKRFGPSVPAKAYIAVDPRHDDRAWFLIDDRWVLQKGFAPDVRGEVRSLLALPALPGSPPVPLPKPAVGLHVVLFG